MGLKLLEVWTLLERQAQVLPLPASCGRCPSVTNVRARHFDLFLKLQRTGAARRRETTSGSVLREADDMKQTEKADWKSGSAGPDVPC